jgi:hypothetical protein
MSGGFQERTVGVIGWQRHLDQDIQLGDAAGCRGAHGLAYSNGHTAELDVFSLGYNPHDGGHAGAQGSCDQVRGGECFAPSMVVHRGIGDQLGSGGTMGGRRAQTAVVCERNLNHEAKLTAAGQKMQCQNPHATRLV